MAFGYTDADRRPPKIGGRCCSLKPTWSEHSTEGASPESIPTQKAVAKAVRMGRRAAFAHDHSEAAAWMPSLLFFFENALSELTLAANTTSAACGAGPSKNRALCPYSGGSKSIR